MRLWEWFTGVSPVWQALIATLFTWGVTAAGAASVFAFRKVSERLLHIMLGFAAGVMIAASFWSLLAPAIEIAGEMGGTGVFPAVVGFLAGGLFLWGADKLLPHLHPGSPPERAEGLPTKWRKSALLILAITLHNIPEGLAVGVAFGAVAHGLESATIGGAVALAIGIGLQNFPEGTAVAAPLRMEGMSRTKAFLCGQASAIVEPIAGVIGALAVMQMRPLLPYALAFAAGAMMFVVIEELVPRSQTDVDADAPTAAAMLGFAAMMMLDVGLG
jgi:zinc transporter, ZIP family